MRGRKRIEWANTRQGKLTIVAEVGRDRHGNVLWRCLCDCGNECVKPNRALASGVKSCSTACSVSDSNKARAKHGMWKTKEYQTWLGMKQRCTNTKSTHYASYGGRGISVHPAWLHSFEQFLADVGSAPESALSLDRIDNDGNYEPGNVRWATPREQINNRRRTLSDAINGEVLPLADLAREHGVAYTLVFQRYKRGLRGVELLTPQKIGRKPSKKGTIMNKQQIRALAEGVAESQFYAGHDIVWEPFEGYDEEWIHEQVQSLADSIENAIYYAMKELS